MTPATLSQRPVLNRSPTASVGSPQAPPPKAAATSLLGPVPRRAAQTVPSDRASSPSKAAIPVDDQARVRRQALKDQAQKQILALVERIKTLKQYASNDPKLMAKQLAQIVKDLKVALKAYADAGGSGHGAPPVAAGPSTPVPVAQTADAPDGPDAPDQTLPVAPDEAAEDAPQPTPGQADDPPRYSTPDTSETPDPSKTNVVIDDTRNHGFYARLRDAVSGSEAVSDTVFVKTVRGIVKTIRDLEAKAKIQTAIQGPDDETRTAFKATDDGLKAVGELLDGLDRDIRASSPEAGLFVALWA